MKNMAKRKKYSKKRRKKKKKEKKKKGKKKKGKKKKKKKEKKKNREKREGGKKGRKKGKQGEKRKKRKKRKKKQIGISVHHVSSRVTVPRRPATLRLCSCVSTRETFLFPVQRIDKEGRDAPDFRSGELRDTTRRLHPVQQFSQLFN